MHSTYILILALTTSIYLIFSALPTASNTKAYSPEPGSTINSELQSLVETHLHSGLVANRAEQGVVLIMDAQDGSIKAVASAANQEVCKGAAKCRDAEKLAFIDWQPGSVMKPLILAAAINEGRVTPETTFYDDGEERYRGRLVQNATYDSYGTVSMQQVISSSINMGAIFLLTRLGDNKIDGTARQTWWSYLVSKYKFAQTKSLGNTVEGPGFVRPPKGGTELDFNYAGSSFGIGLTVTPVRLAAAYVALVNDGIYHQPRIVKTDEVTAEQILKPSTSTTMTQVLSTAVKDKSLSSGYKFGGKTGTAPLPDGDGFYRKDKDSGTFVGFIGGSNERYVMLVRLDAPVTDNFASYNAQDLWLKIAATLKLDNL